jgi:protein SCO1/2
MRRFGFSVLLMTLALFASCHPRENATLDGSAPKRGDGRKVYHARGVIKGFPSPTTVKIAHEEIPGYMAAMTMALGVKNTNELKGMIVGDQITFDVVVTKDDGWIENLKSLGAAPPVTQTNTNETPHFRRVRDVDPLSVGDTMPDYPFVTEDGKRIRLSDFKGQAIALTFFFTRCPFPTFCPRMSSNFEKAAKELSKPGNPTNWHFLSISFDTEVDTPEQLKRYATRYEHDPSKWNFVTSELIEIDAITEQFGVVFAKQNGSINHNLRTVVIDANNKIQQILVGNEWSVDEFVAEVKKAAQAKKE